jgi:hypothetical protein
MKQTLNLLESLRNRSETTNDETKFSKSRPYGNEQVPWKNVTLIGHLSAQIIFQMFKPLNCLRQK